MRPLLSAAARRRLLQTTAGGGLLLLGVVQQHNRRQSLLRPGPLPEGSEDTGVLDSLLVSALSRAPGLSPTWEKRIIVQWAAADDHAVAAQTLHDLGVHRVALSCLKDAANGEVDADRSAVVVDALRALQRISCESAPRRALLDSMGRAHWAALVALSEAAGDAPNDGGANAADLAAAALGRFLSDVADDMASRPDPLALYAGLELRHSPADAFALGLRAVSAPPPSAPHGDPGTLVLPLLGLALLTRHVDAAPGGLAPVMSALCTHAAALPGALDAATSAARGGSAALGGALWLRALSEAAAATAREARLTAFDAGPEVSPVPSAAWLSVGCTCLLGIAAIGPPAAADASGGADNALRHADGRLEAIRASIAAVTAISELLVTQPVPAAGWGRIAEPALHAFALRALAPAALTDVLDRARGGEASAPPPVLQGLCAPLADALAATLACFPPALRCELALARPTADMLAPWLDMGAGRQRLRDAHALVLMQLSSASASAAGGAGAPPRLLPPSRIPGSDTRGERVTSPSDRAAPHIDEDAATATFIGISGALAPLAEDLLSAFPSPRARDILRRGYGPLATPSLRPAPNGLPDFPVLRRSRQEGGCTAAAAADKGVTIRVLPSAVDLLCGLTRNLPGTAAAEAAEGALAGLLAPRKLAPDDGRRLAAAQVLIAQAWLASALSGAVDSRAQGAAGPDAAATPPRRLAAPLAASTVRELLRWVRRHTEPLPPSRPAPPAPLLPPPPWQLREGTPVDLLPPFVAEKIVAPALQARTAAAAAATADDSAPPRRVPLFDELALPYIHASSAFHVHLCKALAYLPSVPRDGSDADGSSQGQQHVAAALALRLAEQGVVHPLLFLARFYAEGLEAWQRSAGRPGAGSSAECGPLRPLLRLQMDPGYREAVSALRQCLRLSANIAYALRPPAAGEPDAPDPRAARLLRESWAGSAAAWRGPCETADVLEDLKAHCHAVRLLYNLAALSPTVATATGSEARMHLRPSYGDSTMPLLPLPVAGDAAVVAEVKRPVDLVFVHGLQGAGLKTWRCGSGWCASHAPDDDGFGGSAGFPFYCLSTSTHAAGRRVPIWPALWLAPAAAAAGLTPRPLVLVYDSDVWSAESVRPLRSLEEVAFELCCQLRDACVGVAPEPTAEPAPVVFVGHSMGGLVIKHVLRGASALAATGMPGGPWEAFNLPGATAGIAFIATPHAGSPVASWMCRRLSTVHRWLPGGGTTTAGPWAAPLLGLLREGNAGLVALDSDFQCALWGGASEQGLDADASAQSESGSHPTLRKDLHRNCGRVAILSLVEGSPLPVFSGGGTSDAAAGAATPLGPVPAKIVSPTKPPKAAPLAEGGAPAVPAPAKGSPTVAGRIAALRGLVGTIETPRAAVVVVHEASACPGYGLCAVVPGADHVQVCKPDSAGPGDARFALIHALVNDVANRSTGTASYGGQTGSSLVSTASVLEPFSPP